MLCWAAQYPLAQYYYDIVHFGQAINPQFFWLSQKAHTN